MMQGWDYEDGAPEQRVVSTTRPRARIPHDCDQCRSRIMPGHVYNRQAVVIDGEFQVFKNHHDPPCFTRDQQPDDHAMIDTDTPIPF